MVLRALPLLAFLAIACSSQTVVDAPPIVIVTVSSHSLSRVDLLFAIDNSPAMGDKQALFADAAASLIQRLLVPQCTDGTRTFPKQSDGTCASGTHVEFDAIPDLHVAIVSSSLGGGGSEDVCVADATDSTHQDDRGHLLDRTRGTPEGQIANARPLDGLGGNFLAWLPTDDPANQGKPTSDVTPYVDGKSSVLIDDMQSLVNGVGENGCVLEAQLESWYRFLIQPDPYDHIEKPSGTAAAALVGIDATLLKMRHDFLRSDSLVAIVQLTDEDDSWSDPVWEGGFGWATRTVNFPGGPGGDGVGPRGTHECDAPIDPNDPNGTGPNDPDCVSCAFASNNKPVAGTPVAEDANCNACAPGASTCAMRGWYTPAQDGLNVRYAQQAMKQRYGFDSQYDIQRYVDGLALPTVPDRDHEARAGTSYASTVRNCINPLYANTLTDGSDTSPSAICSGLKTGSRTPEMIFYGLIGGIPSALVGDWTHTLGNDPGHYFFGGIDPHMIESIVPRATLAVGGTSYDLGTDPVHGRDYDTHASAAGIDLQYACTFTLPAPKDCTLAANAAGCDCVGAATTSPNAPPLCDPANRSMQVRGKAYPTIRELRVAKGLGAQAVVGSICASVVSAADASLSTYGYRPTIDALVDRMRLALAGECLPAPLPTAMDGTTVCHALVVFDTPVDQTTACNAPGLAQPSGPLSKAFAALFTSPLADAGVDAPSACDIAQLASCAPMSPPGFCYEQGTSSCAQRIAFTAAWAQPAGTHIVLACPASK